MTHDEYLREVLRTASCPSDKGTQKRLRLMSGYLKSAIGISKEGGELLDQIYRHIYYGGPLDRLNLFEELGDVLWYVGLMAHLLDSNLEAIMAANVAKLRRRYPDGFDRLDAMQRDLEEEIKALGEFVDSPIE